MKIGYVILARCSSSRFPNKVLTPVIEGMSPLELIYRKISEISDNLIIATSEDASDDKIAELAEGYSWNIFRGSLENVSTRFLRASKQISLDYSFRVNADNIIIPLDLYQFFEDQIRDLRLNFYTNLIDRTFPYGVSVESVNVGFYEEIIDRFADKDQEHVTSFIYSHLDSFSYFSFKNQFWKNLPGRKLALDSQEDLVELQKIYGGMQDSYFQIGLNELNNYYNGLEK